MRIPTTSNRYHFTRVHTLSVYNLQFLQNMFVITVVFGKDHKNMLAHVKQMLE